MPVEYRRALAELMTKQKRGPRPVAGEYRMGKVTGFLEIDRQDRKYKPAADRIRHYHEFVNPLFGRGDARPGGALHELRHSLLP